jgi:hypothetical protein
VPVVRVRTARVSHIVSWWAAASGVVP